MKRAMLKCTKIISFILILSILTVNGTHLVYATEVLTNIDIQDSTDDGAVKKDLTFLEGSIGETYIVYTYEENNETYKIVEYANEEYTNIYSEIYILNANNTFDLQYTQTYITDEKGIVKISFNRNGVTENRIISPEETRFFEQTPFSSNSEWITSVTNSYKGGLRGLTYAAIYGIIKGICIYYFTGDAKGAVVEGVTTVTDYLFTNGLDKIYYRSVYNWRHSPKNYLVMDETSHISYYTDSAHKYYMGYTYSEWIY